VARGVSADRDLNRALPRLNVDDSVQQAPNTWNAQNAQNAQGMAAGTPSGAQVADPQTQIVRAQEQGQGAPAAWRQLRDAAEVHRTRGEVALAASSFRHALEQNPPDADRIAIAQALHDLLQRSGQIVEATQVHAQYLARPNNAAELANAVPTPSNSTPRPAASRPMPSRAAPRMRRAPASQDSYSNAAY
jgi:hypothetical protein